MANKLFKKECECNYKVVMDNVVNLNVEYEFKMFKNGFKVHFNEVLSQLYFCSLGD